MTTLRIPRQYSDVLAIAKAVRQYIQNNSLKPGDKLPAQDVLCQELGIGLRRLREALGILRQQGLIETKTKGGTRIKAFSTKAFEEPISWHLDEQKCSFEELIRARAILESGAAGEAAVARTARDLLNILDAIEQLETAEADSPEHHRADEQFHLAVLQAANNQALLVFGKLIAGQFNRKKAMERRKSPSVWKRSIAEHRAIFQFIEKGDSELAKKEMVDHILKQRRNRKARGNSSKRP